jgi:two-component system, chemotaxis family, protein-glutamate methylesterase/glutaminase
MAQKSAIKLKALLIGGSAGALEVVVRLLPDLRRDLSYAIVIILHRANVAESALHEVLAIRSSLPVREIEDKMALDPGRIYVAPADYHVLFEKNALFALDDSEKVNFSRPSIDVSFESAAESYGSACAALLLSGGNTDGSMGLKRIMACGGKVFIQEPGTAQVDYMPQAAIERVPQAIRLKPEEMADCLNGL